jgi:hypothetical protein
MSITTIQQQVVKNFKVSPEDITPQLYKYTSHLLGIHKLVDGRQGSIGFNMC